MTWGRLTASTTSRWSTWRALPRTDIYASGAVLFECVTGRPVFTAPTVTAMMMKHVEEAPEDPRAVNPEVPGTLAQVILRALAKKKEDRWSSAAALHEALDGVEG